MTASQVTQIVDAPALLALQEIVKEPSLPVRSLSEADGGLRSAALREAFDHIASTRIGAAAGTPARGAALLEELAEVDTGLANALRWHVTVVGLLAALPPNPARNAALGDVHRGSLLTWTSTVHNWNWSDAGAPTPAVPTSHVDAELEIDEFPGLYDAIVVPVPDTQTIAVLPTSRRGVTWTYIRPARTESSHHSSVVNDSTPVELAQRWSVRLSTAAFHRHDVIPLDGDPASNPGWHEHRLWNPSAPGLPSGHRPIIP